VVTESKFNSVELESIEIDTILSVPFCPYHFVRTILSNTILSGHQLSSWMQCGRYSGNFTWS